MVNSGLDRQPTTRSIRLLTSVALVSLAVLIVGFSAAAQSTATFSGSVVDPMNSVIPKATVSLINAHSEATHEVQSDQSGHFAFVALPAGNYRLEAQFPGFRTLRDTVTLAGRDVVRTLELPIGGVVETVTVAFDPRDMRPGSPQVPVSDRRPAARTLQECTATSTGGNVRPPKKLTHVPPQYPTQLAGTGVKGAVILEGRIGTDGFIRDLKVLRPVHPDLDAAAAEAVRQWEFDATLLNCVPVEVFITLVVNFEEGK